MKKIYFTITGMSHYYGDNFFEKGMTVTLVKEKDNEVDSEAIKVELEGLGTVGYVANSPYTVLGESYSAGRLYDASLSSEALPVIAVPTTCGTGSEVTGVSVLTRHDKLTKGSIPQRIFPEIALVDGKYLAAAPETVITATALDALAHMLESALMKAGNDFSRMAVEKGLQVWSRSKPVLEGKREASPADYENLLRASTFAGIAIAQTGTSIPHALSYPVTYDIGLAHGRAVGYFLPGFLREAPEKDRLQLLSLAGFEDLGDFSAFVRGILREVNVPLSTLERGFEMVRSNPSRMKGCIFDLDENGLKRIIWESC